MKFYMITLDESIRGFEATQVQAHAVAKQLVAEDLGDVRTPTAYIDLVDVPVDKAGIENLLKMTLIGRPPDLTPERSWLVTERGGLKESKL